MGYKPQYNNNGNYQKKSYNNNSGSNGGTVEIKDGTASHFLFDCDGTRFRIYDDTNDSDHFTIIVAANGETTYNTTNAAPQSQGTWEMTTPGDAFSFTESFTLGDQVSSGTSVTIEQGSDVTDSTVVGYNVVETLPAFGQTPTTAGGVAGSLAGTITSAGAIGLTAGGAGTTATGQFVSEVTIR